MRGYLVSGWTVHISKLLTEIIRGEELYTLPLKFGSDKVCLNDISDIGKVS